MFIDVTNVSSPKLEPLPALGTCRAPGIGRQDRVVHRGRWRDPGPACRRHARCPVCRPKPPAQTSAVHYVSRDGGLIATSWSNGELEVQKRRPTEKHYLLKQKLAMRLTGNVLQGVAQSPLLSDADREKIRRGATELDVPTGANRLVISDDKVHLAVVLPDRTPSNLRSCNRQERRDGAAATLTPSRHGVFTGWEGPRHRGAGAISGLLHL